MGESKRKRAVAVGVESAANHSREGPQVVDVLGGRMHVRWDEQAADIVVNRPVIRRDGGEALPGVR